MPKAVIVIVSNPVGKDDTGIVAEGFYTRDGDQITMTDKDGLPLRSEDTGARFTVRLEPGQDEKAEAKRLTLRLHRAANADAMSDFHSRPLRYPDRGWA
jgi:hypothetical protein